jgi:toxin ParE1/3/4
MSYDLVIEDEAIHDMLESFEWYEKEKLGLGTEFLDEVDSYFDKICVYPEHYQELNFQRVAVLKRFPFKIVYEVKGSKIIVYAVYHSKRNPRFLEER